MELIDLLIPALVFLVVVAIGGVIAASVHRRKAIKPRLEKVQESPFSNAQPEIRDSPGTLARLGTLVAGGGASKKLRQELARAGYYSEGAAAVFLGTKMVMLIVAIFGSLALVLFTDLSFHVKVLIIIIASGLLFFAPNVALDIIKRNRGAEIRRHLPDAVDLLEVCVTAGMGLDMAWNAVTEEIRPVCPILADEMALTNLEMQLGASRAAAMRRMAERTGAEELSSLVAMLVQSDRFGTSIGDTLRTFTISMRENRSQIAEEAAEKMAVKILFPMVLFIFPVMLIITVGPAGLAIAKMISEN